MLKYVLLKKIFYKLNLFMKKINRKLKRKYNIICLFDLICYSIDFN